MVEHDASDEGPGGRRADGWWLASDGAWYPPETHPHAERVRPLETPALDATMHIRPEAVYPPTQPSYPHNQAPSYQQGQMPNYNLYSQPGAQWAAPQQIVVANATKSPGMAIASLVLGVGAFFFALIPLIGFLSVPFAICGVALGVAGVVRAQKGFEGMGLSIAGIATSTLALLLSVLYFAFFASVDPSGDMNSDPSDGICNSDRFWEDPDC